jgi:hypothetical protein
VGDKREQNMSGYINAYYQLSILNRLRVRVK